MKLAARRVPSLDRVFINDLHELSAHVLEDLTTLWLNPDQALEGSGAPMRSDPDQALGGSGPDIPITMSIGDTAMMTLDPADWRAPLLAYILEEVLPPEKTEA